MVLTICIIEKMAIKLVSSKARRNFEIMLCRKVLGYLNLMANCTDNLLHGLAVGTSFLTSWKLGDF